MTFQSIESAAKFYSEQAFASLKNGGDKCGVFRTNTIRVQLSSSKVKPSMNGAFDIVKCVKLIVAEMCKDSRFQLGSEGGQHFVLAPPKPIKQEATMQNKTVKAAAKPQKTNVKVPVSQKSGTSTLSTVTSSLASLSITDTDGGNQLHTDAPEFVPRHSATQHTMEEAMRANLTYSEVAAQNADHLPLMSTEERKQFTKEYFKKKPSNLLKNQQKAYALISGFENSTYFEDSGLLGQLIHTTAKDTCNADESDNSSIFMNTNEPFCMVAVGTQGNGKSHTVTCVLESCLIPFPEGDIINLQTPMNAVVFHYDQNVNYMCEAIGLAFHSEIIAQLFTNNVPRNVSKDNVTVLVSPQNYYNRAHFYGEYCTVKPLLFEWEQLTADHIKRIMGIDENGTQLYMSSLLDVLKSYQRLGKPLPEFNAFKAEVMELCKIPGQEGPLNQRINLLASLVRESDVNQHLAAISGDLRSCCAQAGTLVICDLSDPLLAKQDANNIFQVLAEQYRGVKTDEISTGKLLVIDEAHKFMDGTASDGLSNAIVNIARLMRHDGMRLIVSTQSPKALAPELLELSTLAVMHQFSSSDWFDHMKSKLPLESRAFEYIMNLSQGEALVYARRHLIRTQPEQSPTTQTNGEDNNKTTTTTEPTATSQCGYNKNSYRLPDLGANIFPISIRPRVTRDLGASKTNIVAAFKNVC